LDVKIVFGQGNRDLNDSVAEYLPAARVSGPGRGIEARDNARPVFIDYPVLKSAGIVVAVMTLSTAYIGPGLGVEANYVTMQTSGKTLIVTIRDFFAAARFLVDLKS
jgi:hypothetical protein